MKRRVLLFIAIILILSTAGCLLGCYTDIAFPPYVGGVEPDDPNGDPVTPPVDPDDDTPVKTVYINVNGGTAYTLTEAYGADMYYIEINLTVGDRVTFYDNGGKTYASYNGEFDGTAKRSGVHSFELRMSGTSGIIYVTQPTVDPEPNPTPNPNPEPDPEPEKPKNTKVKVYYTNSDRWNAVYAYVWNYSTGEYKTEWPGEKLSVVGTSGFNEKQYAIEVDYSLYDRIIFNDNGSNKTEDLIVGGATSGYYGKDGIFTMGEENYGKVEYFTLKDTVNLSYTSSKSKKFSVYTPRGYTPAKKYGVIYMFDSQNLYAAASGIEPSHDDYGSWAVDVAVINMVKNGNDGVIIVAIDNTDGYRDSELTMSQSFGTLTSLADNDAFRNGKLDQLGDFIKNTLMPWVQSKYSVDPSRAKTGIAGSSSGGLAAYYLGLRDNDLYGYIGAFSPANGLFTSSDWNRFYAKKNFATMRPDIYAYCGQNDKGLEDMLLPAVKQIKNLTSYGYKAGEITENYLNGASHSENYWRIAFTEFLSKCAM